MPVSVELIPVAMPGLRVVRWTTDEPYAGMKEVYAVARVETGRSEWMGAGKLWRSGPGSLQLKQPGDFHRDVSCDGPIAVQIVSFPVRTVENLTSKVRVPPLLAANDERGAAFHRLHDAVTAGADRLALEVLVAETLANLAALGDAGTAFTRPVRRALDVLRERLSVSGARTTR